MVTTKTNPLERRSIRIWGQIQGVGFRPYIHRLATRYSLTGFIQNTDSGIDLEIQGHHITKFLVSLPLELPPLAKITAMEVNISTIQPQETHFTILESKKSDTKALVLLPPDTAPCDECLQEFLDPSSRYFYYPFINCTNCGPRLSITKKLPYDRKHTSMEPFILCPLCYQDYHDIAHRRYHAQPMACPACGPKLSMPIEEIAKRILNGDIIAIKGVGGYQLMCDAKNEATLLKLREKKQRKTKAFALMVLNIASAKTLVECDKVAIECLTRPSRPIVLLPKKQKGGGSLPNWISHIAPELSHLAIMLPNSPLQYLLFSALCEKMPNWIEKENAFVLIVTSANLAGEPLITQDLDAEQQLAEIAEVTVSYNREIITRLDDSLVSIIQDQPRFIRRARGYVPHCIQLPHEIPPMIGVGGFLKNTICMTRRDQAFLSQHIGDTKNPATIDFFHETFERLYTFLKVKPNYIAHDLHPDFYASQFAKTYGLETVAIQHHHAHLAAVMAEHHLTEPVLGLALDGHGLGTDGTLWGGELLMLSGHTFERLGSLTPLPLPGGEKASREPWRMAASALYCLNRAQEITHYATPEQAPIIIQMLKKKMNTPMTSSCGRLFDAAAGLLGICSVASYEAEAAMKLESLVSETTVFSGGWSFENDQLNLLPTLEKLLELDPVKGANLFHGTLIEALKEWIIAWSQKTKIKTLVLGGGCFLNNILTEGLIKALSSKNLTVYLPTQAPPNDGGLSLGQVWIGGLYVSSTSRSIN